MSQELTKSFQVPSCHPVCRAFSGFVIFANFMAKRSVGLSPNPPSITFRLNYD